MTQRRHSATATATAAAVVMATLLLGGCKRSGPEPPGGELRSALTAPTLAGGQFDPAALGDKITMVLFWSPG